MPLSHLTRSETILNREGWLWSPENIKEVNKDAKIHVGRSATVRNILFCTNSLCMNINNGTKTFLFVSSSVSSKQLLCFVHGQGQRKKQKTKNKKQNKTKQNKTKQKNEQKHATKNFVGFHNHFPLLTLVEPKSIVTCLHAFSRASRQLRVITSSFDWFTVLFVSFVIG